MTKMHLFYSVCLAAMVQMSCTTPRTFGESELLTTADSGSRKTACMSFQGNGTYFSSHIGALIALLEADFQPALVTGGSSGAIIAALARALVDNKSLSDGGRFAPQAAARILASSGGVIESVLFLPRFTTPLMLMDSFDVFYTGSKQGALFGEARDGMVNAESIVGQSALVIDFFRSTSFSEALKQPTVQLREAAVSELWTSYTNAIRVSPNDAADAIFSDKGALESEGRLDLVLIQDRFFKMFRSKYDGVYSNYKTQQADWNTFLVANGENFGLRDPVKRRAAFRGFLEKIKSIQNFDAIYASFSGSFLLMDPDRVWAAFSGFDPSGKPMSIPSNVVLHSTSRRGRKKDGVFKEQIGLQSVHQIYFANTSTASRAREALYGHVSNPLKPAADGFEAAIPSERILVTESSLGPALAASTGEPTAFTRTELKLDAEAMNRVPWLSQEDSLIGYGGWLEKNALGTARKFSECAPDQVDLYLASGDGAKLDRYQKMAFFGLLLEEPLRGALADRIDNSSGVLAFMENEAKRSSVVTSGDQLEEIENAARSVQQLFAESLAINGRMGRFPYAFNHNSPSSVKGTSNNGVDISFRSNRRAMVLASYEYTRGLIQGIGGSKVDINMFGVPSSQLNILSKTSSAEVDSLVGQALPRP